jgi:hypothetical protein
MASAAHGERTPTAELLRQIGLPGGDREPAPSIHRFPDGASYRIEIPSVEGPAAMEVVLAEADRLSVPVTRVSQGSGIGMLTNAEITRMVELGSSAGVEVCLFVRPTAGWDIGAASRAPAGAPFGVGALGQDHVAAGIDAVRRAADLGIRSVLIADIGVLYAFGRLRALGVLPADMQAKVSVMLAIGNAGTAKVISDLGADTINVSPDLSVAQMASVRAVTTAPIDVYIEAPDDIGGFVRYHDVPRVVVALAPVYVKLGVRNAPNIYPAGKHLEPVVLGLAAERVRRARLALDLLADAGVPLAECSQPGAPGLAIPHNTEKSD